MRLFLSCNIPLKITTYLQSLAEQVSSLNTATVTIPKQFDLTMKFFGDVSETAIPELCHRLESIHISPFEVALEKIHVFDEERIRIVWVGVAPKEPLFSLHAAIEKALLPLFPQDDRFSPHITLARVKTVHNKKIFLEKLQSIEVEPLVFSIDQVILFQSTTTQNGAIHTALFTVLPRSNPPPIP